MQHDTVNQWIDAGELRALAESLMTPVPSPPASASEAVYGDHFVGYTESTSADPRHAVAAAEGAVRDAAMRSLLEARGKVNQAGLVAQSQVQAASAIEYSQPPEPIRATVTNRAKEEAAIHRESEASLKSQSQRQISSPFRLAQKPMRPVQQGPAQQQVIVTNPPVLEPQAVQAGAKEGLPGTPASSSPSGQPLARRMQAFGAWLKQAVPAEAFFVCDRNGDIIADEVGNEKLIKVARTLAHAASSAGREIGDVGGLSNSFVKIGVDRVLQVIPKRSKFGLVVLGVIVPQQLSREAAAVIAQSLSKTLGDEV
ncbi:MAG: hypothetical protein ACON5H_10665 [Akkermansiaceae bacterium]